MLDIMGLDVVPDMLFLSLDDPKIVLDPVIHMVAGDIRQICSPRNNLCRGKPFYLEDYQREWGNLVS
jgi:hypothetical protein